MPQLSLHSLKISASTLATSFKCHTDFLSSTGSESAKDEGRRRIHESRSGKPFVTKQAADTVGWTGMAVSEHGENGADSR